MKNVELTLDLEKTKIMASSPITSWQIYGETMETVKTLFSWTPKSLQMVNAAMKFKVTYFFERQAMTNLDSLLKRRGIFFFFFANKDPFCQSYGFSSSHVCM